MITLAIYSEILNNHQANLADELYKILGKNFIFVETTQLEGIHKKGSSEDYSKKPYLLQAWRDKDSVLKAKNICLGYDVCVFDGAWCYEKMRVSLGKFSFEFSERWLKGYKNCFSPRMWRNIITYHLYGWKNKPLYKLCASAYAKRDQLLLRTFKDKCYKFGYFTQIPDAELLTCRQTDVSLVRIMWCSRFIDWKHPEMAIDCARKLNDNGYNFQLDMYGDGELRNMLEAKVKSLNLSDIVKFHGNVPNDQIYHAMRSHDIFLFTSDKGEGWGAVANEAMSNGCCLVGSDEIGSVPYLVKNGENGLVFRSKSLDDLYLNVEKLFNNRILLHNLSEQGQKDMAEGWSARNAAKSLLTLIDDLSNGRETSIKEGPCSKA